MHKSDSPSDDLRRHSAIASSSSQGQDGGRQPKARPSNKGYTPANFVHYSKKEEDR